jgi:hypothetical protein
MKGPRVAPLKFQFSHRMPVVIGRNLVASYPPEDNINLLYVPPSMSRKPIKQWTIPFPLPSDYPECTAYPPKNILIVVYIEEG